MPEMHLFYTALSGGDPREPFPLVVASCGVEVPINRTSVRNFSCRACLVAGEIRVEAKRAGEARSRLWEEFEAGRDEVNQPFCFGDSYEDNPYEAGTAFAMLYDGIDPATNRALTDPGRRRKSPYFRNMTMSQFQHGLARRKTKRQYRPPTKWTMRDFARVCHVKSATRSCERFGSYEGESA